MATADSPFEASRLANQIVSMASAGFDPYCFKFSMTPSSAGGVTKSGIFWGDNTIAPYPVGDATMSGEAMAQIAGYVSGSKPLLTCAPPTSYTQFGGYLYCVTVQDTNKFHIIVSNDFNGLGTSGYGTTADPTYPAPPGQAFTLSMDLGDAGLHVPATSFAVINEVSSPSYFGEVSAYLPLYQSRVITHTLPAFGTMRVTVPANPQTESLLTSTQSATIAAGANTATNYGGSNFLHVGTSITSIHDGTVAALLLFDLTGYTANAAAANVAMLELTVAAVTVNSEASVLSVIGLNACTGTSWSESTVTWSSASAFGVSAPTGTISGIVNNFVKLGPSTTTTPGNSFAGHITVSGTDVGNLKRVDVTRYINTIAQGGATKAAFLIVRRFRSNGICTGSKCPSCIQGVCTNTALGNAAGFTPADDLDGGATVAFYSDDFTSNPPQLRMIADSTVMEPFTAAVPGLCSSSPPPATPGSTPGTAPGTTPTPASSPVNAALAEPPSAPLPPLPPAPPEGYASPSLSPPPPSPPASPPPSPPAAPPSSVRYLASYLHLPGYSVDTFTPLQQDFINGIALVLSVNASAVTILAITSSMPATTGRHLRQAVDTVDVQFEVQTTQGAYSAISAALTTSVFNDSLLTTLVANGLPLLVGPIVAVQGAAVNTVSLSTTTQAPSDATTTLNFGLGIGLGLGIPVTAGLCCIAREVWRSCRKPTKKVKAAVSDADAEAAHAPSDDAPHESCEGADFDLDTHAPAQR
jgi:hypothetical protein